MCKYNKCPATNAAKIKGSVKWSEKNLLIVAEFTELLLIFYLLIIIIIIINYIQIVEYLFFFKPLGLYLNYTYYLININDFNFFRISRNTF